MSARPGIASSALAACGHTPLVDLRRLCDGFEGRILAKLETQNPTRSGKDRVASQVMRDARQDGRLMPHGTVVVDGPPHVVAAFASACAVLGHPLVVVEPAGTDARRATALSVFGAEVVPVDLGAPAAAGILGSEQVDRLARESERVAAERGATRFDLFRDVGAFRAHRLGTGAEILRQCGGDLSYFCDVVGTGATFAGCAAAIREYSGDVRCIVVEPQGTAVLSGDDPEGGRHWVPGRAFGRKDLPLVEAGWVDGHVRVGEDEALDAREEIARREGIRASIAGAVNVAAARKLLKRSRGPGTTVVTILDGPDDGG